MSLQVQLAARRAARTLGGEGIEVFFVGCERQHRFRAVLPDFYPREEYTGSALQPRYF